MPEAAHRRETVSVVRVVGASSRNAWADFGATFTPLTWSLGWLGRIVAQVIFYALIGELLGSPERVRYLYVGAAVLATAMETLLVVSTTTRERYTGTLPLLVASPSRLWPVFLGRSVQWLPSGVATAAVALFVVGPFFGVTFGFWQGIAAFGVLVLVALTTYGYGLALAALVLRHMRLRNWATNLSYTVMMLVCGVTVPLSFWPPAVQVLGQVFPLTHTLAAIRQLEGDGDPTTRTLPPDPATNPGPWIDPYDLAVPAHVGLAVATALVWYVIAAISLERLGSTGRRDGSIEFAD